MLVFEGGGSAPFGGPDRGLIPILSAHMGESARSLTPMRGSFVSSVTVGWMQGFQAQINARVK